MDGWALSTTAKPKALQAVLEAAFTARGFVRADGTDGMLVQLLPHDRGTLLLVEYELPNLALARDITERLGTSTRFLELRLEDTTVSGRRIELPDGAQEDVDEAAHGILHDWNDGEDRKFLTESYSGLAEALLDVDRTEKPVELWFKSSATLIKSARVATMVKTIQAGGRWERTTIGNQPAIRVVGPNGTQISVLTPAEEAELMAALKA